MTRRASSSPLLSGSGTPGQRVSLSPLDGHASKMNPIMPTSFPAWLFCGARRGAVREEQERLTARTGAGDHAGHRRPRRTRLARRGPAMRRAGAAVGTSLRPEPGSRTQSPHDRQVAPRAARASPCSQPRLAGQMQPRGDLGRGAAPGEDARRACRWPDRGVRRPSPKAKGAQVSFSPCPCSL